MMHCVFVRASLEKYVMDIESDSVYLSNEEDSSHILVAESIAIGVYSL